MGKNASSAANQQGSLDDPPETTRQMPQMNKNLAILLSLLFTDGGVSPKGVNSWRIYFANKSKPLIDLFQDCIAKVFDLDINRVRISKTKNGFFQAVVDSKEIGNYLVTTFGTFRTLKFKTGNFPSAKLPVSQLLKSGWTREFLKTAFTCDGGTCFYPAYRKGARGGTRWLIRTVFLSCFHPKLRADYIYLLKTIGIEARNVPKDGKIKIETEIGIRRFYERAGFIQGVKVGDHSKFWKGYEKQEVLKLIISSYDDPSKIYNLPKFHLR